jgi:hypothetical protein
MATITIRRNSIKRPTARAACKVLFVCLFVCLFVFVFAVF